MIRRLFQGKHCLTIGCFPIQTTNEHFPTQNPSLAKNVLSTKSNGRNVCSVEAICQSSLESQSARVAHHLSKLHVGLSRAICQSGGACGSISKPWAAMAHLECSCSMRAAGPERLRFRIREGRVGLPWPSSEPLLSVGHGMNSASCTWKVSMVAERCLSIFQRVWVYRSDV